jgi:hypothetical protein
MVEAVADETAESVTVSVRVPSSGQPGATAFLRDVTVQLDAPVGSRQVRATDGRPLSVLE